jgi:hypothetical protein
MDRRLLIIILVIIIIIVVYFILEWFGIVDLIPGVGHDSGDTGFLPGFFSIR